MKKEIQKLTLSALTATAFIALGVGTTFALFTSRSRTKINIESGIVEVAQNFNIVSVFEKDGTVPVSADSEGVYRNTIGNATYVDDQGALNLEKWCPGDKVVLTLQNLNLSNVTILTRFEESHTSDTDPDLYDALDISYEFEAGYSSQITEANYKEWTELGAPETENNVISTITITIEFIDSHDGTITFDDANDDNPYQRKSCVLWFAQEAVQGNAHIPDTSKGYADSYEEEIGGVTYEVNELAEPEHFEQMLDDLAEVDASNPEEVEEAQKTIFKLAGDIDMEGSENVNKGTLYGTLDGNGHKIENVHYETSSASAAGIFAKYYDGAVVKDLELDDIEIKGKENVGALFGQSYPHASGASTTVPGTELTIENVTIGSNVTVSGTKGLGGIAGSTRWIETLTLRNCVNNADINADVYNVGGFFGTLAGVKNLVIDNCVNNGNIRGTHNVGGFIGQSPALLNVTITDSANHGRITDFSKNGNEANAGWFLACHAAGAELNYSGNVNDGTIYYVSENASLITVFEKDLVGDTDAAGIKVAEGKTWEDYMILDDTVVLQYEIDSNNQFVVSEVTGADHYTVTMQVWGRDVTLEGNTATVVKEKFLAYSEDFDSVEDLHDGFGRITRAGYFLDSTYTQYDYDPAGGISHSSTMNGRANFFRLPFAQKDAYAETHEFNKPSYDATLGEWVFLLDGEAECLPGTAHIMSPKNTSVTYIISAYDANGHVLANCVHKDDAAGMNPGEPTDVSGSFLLNMAGESFWSAGPGTATGDKVYDPVA
jgi:hypothetical protein